MAHVNVGCPRTAPTLTNEDIVTAAMKAHVTMNVDQDYTI
jgi:hypothetical protein